MRTKPRQVATTLAGAALAMLVSVPFGGAEASAATGQDITAIAQGQLGKGCSTGGWRCDPNAWCSDFVKWVWDTAGIDTGGIGPAAASVAAYGQQRGTTTGEPHVGDAVVYNYDGVSWAEHVNLVVGVRADGMVQTVGGNEGASPGSVLFHDWHRATDWGSVRYVRPVGVEDTVSVLA
uniref:CHAP domain-containing protein n=1 Tax=Amycolatopsis kentuckyensis TaxID=218823 RepID=UPI001177DA03